MTRGSDPHSQLDGTGGSRAGVRVYLVDDHEIVREGLRRVLEDDPGIRVVGQSGTVAQARVDLPALHPDVAVIDGRLPDGSGVELCQLVRDDLTSTRAMLLTSYDDETLIFDAIAAGATGVLLKQVGGTDFVDAVQRVASGESMLHPAVTRRLMSRFAEQRAGSTPGAPAAPRPPAAPRAPAACPGQPAGSRPDPTAGVVTSGRVGPGALSWLTPQERRVLEGIGAGRTNRAIAAGLGVSEKTVKNHVTHVLRKLGLQRRTQAAIVATQLRGRTKPSD